MVLYISYNGLLEPLGQSQVWQYLKELSKDFKIVLITYEKKADWEDVHARIRLLEEVRDAGVRWIPLKYHKRPTISATFYDLLLGFVVSCFVVLKHKIRIVHCRSYLPSILGIILKKVFRIKFIFDMRGFWADERVDGGMWKKNSILYKAGKWFERKFLLNADWVISLTHAGSKEIKLFPYLRNKEINITVIPTCTNLEIFKLDTSKEKNPRFTLGYVGTVSSWYLFDPVMIFFMKLKARVKNAQLVILNRGQHNVIRDYFDKYGIGTQDYILRQIEYRNVAQEIQKMDIGVFFVKTVFSGNARSATKLGEFLACGIPCVSNEGVGDTTRILMEDRAGVLLKDFSDEGLEQGVSFAVALSREADIMHRCRRTAEKYFSLQDGSEQYRNIYHSLLGKSPF